MWTSLFDVFMVDIDKESGMTILYNKSGICPAFISVPLFDFRDDLNVNVILKHKITNYCNINYSLTLILLYYCSSLVTLHIPLEPQSLDGPVILAHATYHRFT